MRIKLQYPWMGHKKGDELDVDYSLGSNLIYVKTAIEIIDKATPVVTAMESPTVDKMVRRGKTQKPHIKHGVLQQEVST